MSLLLGPGAEFNAVDGKYRSYLVVRVIPCSSSWELIPIAVGGIYGTVFNILAYTVTWGSCRFREPRLTWWVAHR